MTTNNRIALVTGANKGIGLEIARQLAEASVSVIIGARDTERGEAAVNDLSSQGLNATFVQIDLVDEASIGAQSQARSESSATFGDRHGSTSCGSVRH